MIKAALIFLLIGLALSLPVPSVLAISGYLLSEIFAFIPMTAAAGPLVWSHSNDFILIAAPMFIMMGELMHRSGVSERLFGALAPWFARVPGQLIHTNIASSAVFATTSVISIALGRCDINNGSFASIAVFCGVTPQAQNTGTSPSSNGTASPQSGFKMSAMPICAGSPTCTGPP